MERIRTFAWTHGNPAAKYIKEARSIREREAQRMHEAEKDPVEGATTASEAFVAVA